METGRGIICDKNLESEAKNLESEAKKVMKLNFAAIKLGGARKNWRRISGAFDA